MINIAIFHVYNIYIYIYTQRNKVGCPKGSTNERKKEYEEKDEDTKYEICCQYKYESRDMTRGKKQLFDAIVNEVRRNFELNNEFQFQFAAAKARICRNKFKACYNSSPLQAIEDKIVALILCMSKIKWSLTASEGLVLVNEVTKGTGTQERLIEYKLNRNMYFSDRTKLEEVGLKYWRIFLRRNCHLLRSKSGRRYVVDCCNWTTYLNFADMYKHIEDVLVNDSKIVKKLSTPQWMDMEGNVLYDEKNAYGCNVEIVMERPAIGIVFDEVGCNISQEYNNAKGGERYLTGVDEQAYISCATISLDNRKEEKYEDIIGRKVDIN